MPFRSNVRLGSWPRENAEIEFANGNFVSTSINLKNKSAGDGCRDKTIEKTILRAFRARTFSRSLGQNRKCRRFQVISALPLPITEVVVHAETGHAPSHGRASFAMCSTRCSASSPTPCKNADFNLWSQGRPRK